MSSVSDPILHDGIPVPSSWAAAKESGCASFFAAADESCPTCGSRRYMTVTLACWRCTTPPAPMWLDIAPSLAVAQERGFKLYTPTEDCPTHPTSPFVTETNRCEGCLTIEKDAALVLVREARVAAEAAEKANILAYMRAERQRHKAATAELKAAEKSTRIITHTTRAKKATVYKRAKRMLKGSK